MQRPDPAPSIAPAQSAFRGQRLDRRTRASGWSALGLAAAVLLGNPAAAAPFLNGFDLERATIAIDRGGPPRDGIPAIDKPVWVPPERSGLQPKDRVLGLVVGNAARAYPVRILNWHEVVNDRIAGKPVVVTYCPLCGTGMAFEPAPGTAEKGYGVSGLLYNSDVLLYDRATESLWSQILSQAVTGPMHGTRLKPLALTHTSWADWRQRHPDTQVLSTQTGFDRDYSRDPYALYASVPELWFEVQQLDYRHPNKAWVLGVRIGGAAKAYPFSALDKALGASGELRDTVGGQPLRIRYHREHAVAEALYPDGRPFAGITSFWFAWVAFHPKTEVWAAP